MKNLFSAIVVTLSLAFMGYMGVSAYTAISNVAAAVHKAAAAADAQ